MLPGRYRRIFALILMLILVPLAPAAARADALDSATAGWKKLSVDARRRTQRAPWMKAIGALERAADSAVSGRRQLALVRAGRAGEELARFSGLEADARRAVKNYLAAAELAGPLADDALLDAARLEEEKLKDPASARRDLARAVLLKGDVRSQAATRLAALPAAPKGAALARHAVVAEPKPAESLEAATAAWQALRADSSRRKYRSYWMTAIAGLEKAGETRAPGRDGALAFMRAGRAAEELSRLSKRRQDAERAIGLYLEVARQCPFTTLVDDALLAAASLESNRLGDLEAARKHLALAAAGKGDLAAEARRLARALARDTEPEHAPVAVAAQAPPVVAVVPELRAEIDVEVPATPQHVEHTETDAEELGALAAALDQEPEPKAMASQVRQLKAAALADTEWSLSEQVGLKVRRIVIDAGHGGHDTGAIGPTGVYEKTVTLAVARQLATTLRARGYEVVLTRDTDVFLALEERTKIANRERGDLFISVHANAHKSRQKSGVETYSLNVASDRFAMRLAARENATTETSVSELQYLLADLATRANTVDSGRLARLVQQSVVNGVAKAHGRPRDLGVKHALFYVLLGTRMPAVLVETAFLSNPAEEKKLASEAYQAALATAIAEGVDRFVDRRAQLASAEN